MKMITFLDDQFLLTPIDGFASKGYYKWGGSLLMVAGCAHGCKHYRNRMERGRRWKEVKDRPAVFGARKRFVDLVLFEAYLSLLHRQQKPWIG